jgi:hypothetical protein
MAGCAWGLKTATSASENDLTTLETTLSELHQALEIAEGKRGLTDPRD